MIRNIVFDFGGVLVEYDFKQFFKPLLSSEAEARWFMSHVFTPEVNAQLDLELEPFSQFVADLKARWPDYAYVIDALDKHYTDIFTREVPGMYDLMTELKAKGYPLLGLSNWGKKVYEVIDKFHRIFSLIDDSLISWQVHQIKPHRDIYESFLRKFNVSAEECVFIDDKPENIATALQVGMHGFVFHDVASLRSELHGLGVL